MGGRAFETSSTSFGTRGVGVMSILVHMLGLYDSQVFEFVYKFEFKQKYGSK